MDMNPDMLEYYNRRVLEYESIYHVPERQPDLDDLRTRLSNHFAGSAVLDIACGTGYWTQFIAKSAKSITATVAYDRHKKLIVDERLRGGMSQAAIEEAQRYDWDKVLAKMVTYYNEVLGVGAPSKSAPFVRPQAIRQRPMVTG